MPERDVQADNTSVRGILWSAVGLLLALAVCMAALGLLVHYYHRASPRDIPTINVLEQQRQDTPPSPRLEVNSPAAGAEVIAQGRSRLQGYGWVDRQQGIARVPLLRARAIILQRGWPDPGQALP